MWINNIHSQIQMVISSQKPSLYFQKIKSDLFSWLKKIITLFLRVDCNAQDVKFNIWVELTVIVYIPLSQPYSKLLWSEICLYCLHPTLPTLFLAPLVWNVFILFTSHCKIIQLTFKPTPHKEKSCFRYHLLIVI